MPSSTTLRIRPKPKKRIRVKKRKKLSRSDAARIRYQQIHNVELDSCISKIDKLHEMGAERFYENPRGLRRAAITFTYRELAEALEIGSSSLDRWLAKAQIPKPILELDTGAKAWHIEEVRVIVQLVGNHQKHFAYYRADHQDLRSEIFSKIGSIRRNQLEK